MLKIATIEDLDLVVEMSMKFANSSKYKEFVDKDTVIELAKDLLNPDAANKIVILHGTEGMIAGIAMPFVFGKILVATELGWWVDPEHRNKKIGAELKEAFEFWANKLGCKLVTLISLDENLSAYYTKSGYPLYEYAHVKVL